MTPRVSIVIPAYEPGPIFRETLLSCLQQDHGDIEVVVALDGEDRAVREAIEEAGDPRVRLIADGRRYGQFANFNRAVDASTGEFIKLLSADDLMARDCISAMLEAFERYPEKAICASRHVNFFSDLEGRVAPVLDLPRPGRQAVRVFESSAARDYIAFYGNQMGGPSNVMLRRSAWWQCGGFDPRIGHLGDHALWNRVVSRHGLILIDRPLIAYRIHENSVTGRDALRLVRIEEPFAIVDDATLGAWFPGKRSWRRQYLRLAMVNVTIGYALSMLRRSTLNGLRAVCRVLLCGGPALLPFTLAIGAWSTLRSSILGLGPLWPIDLPGSFRRFEVGPLTTASVIDVISSPERLQQLHAEADR